MRKVAAYAILTARKHSGGVKNVISYADDETEAETKYLAEVESARGNDDVYGVQLLKLESEYRVFTDTEYEPGDPV